MKHRFILGTMVAMLMVPVVALAQEEYEQRVEIGEWTTWSVAPADIPAFEAAIKKVVKAAEMSGLSSDYRWTISQKGSTFGLYVPHKKMADFDDPDAFVNAFKDTPGEALLTEAFEEFGTLDFETIAREVIETVPAWTYAPEQPLTQEIRFAEVYESWMKPGTEEEAYEEGAEWIAFLKELGYGYAQSGLRVRFGDVDRTIWITWHDDRVAYEGENSFGKLVEQKGAEAKLEDLLMRWDKLIRRYEESTWTSRQDLSYLPST